MLELAGNCWKWLDIAGNGWKWLEMAKMVGFSGNGWKWLDMAENLLEMGGMIENDRH